MKHRLLILAISVIATAMIGFGCSSDNNDNTMPGKLQVVDVNTSGCKTKVDVSANTRADDITRQTRMTIKLDNNHQALVNIYGIWLNCAAEGVEDVRVSLENGIITMVIVPRDTEHDVNCICPYDCSFIMTNVQSGHYQLIVYVAQGPDKTYNPDYPIYKGELTLTNNLETSLVW